jgi:hypothetical protein
MSIKLFLFSCFLLIILIVKRLEILERQVKKSTIKRARRLNEETSK